MTYETYSIISVFCLLGVFVGVLMISVCGIISIATRNQQTEINMMHCVITGLIIAVISVATGAISQQLWRMAFFGSVM